MKEKVTGMGIIAKGATFFFCIAGAMTCCGSEGGLKSTVKKNGIALADASLRWGHLWREGIPFSTLFFNDINHPVPAR